MNNIDKKLNEMFRGNRVCLKSACLNQEKREILYEVISENVLLRPDRDNIEEYLDSLTPSGFESKFSYLRFFIDTEKLLEFLKDFIETNLAVVSCGIDYEQIEYSNYKLRIPIDELVFEFSNSGKSSILSALRQEFLQDFELEFIPRKIIDYDNIKSEITTTTNVLPNYRYIKVSDVQAIFGTDIGENARYICDISGEEKAVVVCGTIKYYNEYISKKDKPYFKFLLEGFTGGIRTAIFPNATTKKKLDKVADGMQVILMGDVVESNGKFEIIATRMAHCILPEVFEMEQKVGLPASSEYQYIKPKKYESAVQLNLLFENATNPNLLGKTFVVFDLETTGLYPDYDKITEIGACKVVDGQITEIFQTLVNPEMKIPERITNLTGIDNKMVENARTIKEVIGDFYKFCEDAILVAHNIEFDYKFLKANSEKYNYIFSNEKLDTLDIARKRLTNLANYKLNTLAEYLKIRLDNHHRAEADCVCAAQILIKLL